MPTPPREPLLTYRDVAAQTGISIGALRKRQSKGAMPKPDLHAGQSPIWYRGTLADWMAGTAPGGRRRRKPVQ